MARRDAARRGKEKVTHTCVCQTKNTLASSSGSPPSLLTATKILVPAFKVVAALSRSGTMDAQDQNRRTRRGGQHPKLASLGMTLPGMHTGHIKADLRASWTARSRAVAASPSITCSADDPGPVTLAPSVQQQPTVSNNVTPPASERHHQQQHHALADTTRGFASPSTGAQAPRPHRCSQFRSLQELQTAPRVACARFARSIDVVRLHLHAYFVC